MSEISGDCRYFLTYTGVKLPFKLSSPLQPTQIENRNTYFRGYFDGTDRLIALQKMVYGEIELEHRYRFDDAGTLRRAEITDCDGELTILEFDESGQPVSG
ncbi:MAG: hypothetical protein FIA97_16235 [Methylococcaceae bacterium]|nr:hypothetical protein [Methylococcaceae bacterium]